MGEIERAKLKIALERHYAAQRDGVTVEELDDLASLMIAEDARARRASMRILDNAAFVASQVRFVPAWVWAAQLAIVALMVWVALAGGDIPPVRWAVGLMSAASVLVCVPTLNASKRHGVVELEYACRFGAARVLAARLLILGCSCALSVALMVAGTSAVTGLGALSVALWACPPYFCSCAGSLATLRHLRPSHAVMASVAWMFSICTVLLAASNAFPAMYGMASLAVWGLAATVALVWLAREALLTVRATTAGLDFYAPRIAVTHE